MIAKDGQNIFDITMQGYGTLNNIFDIIQDNNLDFDSEIHSGYDILINNNKGDGDVKNKIIKLDITFNNEFIVSQITSEDNLLVTTDGISVVTTNEELIEIT